MGTTSGVELGFGIWSMHFIGMVAQVPPFPLFYSTSRIAVSMVAAVLASILATHLAVAPIMPSRFRLTLGAVFVGTGICALHYIGMSAVHFSMPRCGPFQGLQDRASSP
jgi:NO-binding membrane sensor protein with MHYT domain